MSQAKPASAKTSPDPAAAAGSLSQWQLVARGFRKHKLAMWSLRLLIVLYTVAFLAEFFQVSDPSLTDADFAHVPPQLPTWSWADGLHVDAVQQNVDPTTLRKTYTRLADAPVPLAFFASSESYALLGLIPLQRRFFGVDTQQFAAMKENGELPENVKPGLFLFGADRYGRDLFSRVVAGSRISLSIGLVGIAFTFLLGLSIGGFSGYLGGWIDNLIQRTIEIINSIPSLPLWITLAAVFPQEWSPLKVYFSITIVLSALNWTHLARVVRGKILSLREEDYAVAARLLGASHGRILFRHLMPGFTSHIVVVLTLSIPGMILGETALSFLGLGLRAPIVSWGVLLQDCFDIKAVRFYPWLLMPTALIVVTVLAFNFIGDGMRDAADPYNAR